MAEIVKTVRIETGNGERSVKSLKQEINDLRDALLNMDKGGEEWKKTADELTRAQEELNTVMKAGKQAADADASSIAGMEARYKSLYQTFRLLSQEQRNSAKGMSMQKELAELSNNLNSVKKDAGNFKDNIGRYADDMMGAFGQLGISVGALKGPFNVASMGAKGFKKALDTLVKHPVLLALAALVGIIKKVSDAIKGNEELQLRMNKAAAAFKPIGDAMAIVLDKVAGLAVRVAEGIAKVVTWMTNLFGITKKLSGAELELAESENALIKTRREIAELNSEDEARIQELLEEVSITEDKIEKEKLLAEAKELQEKVNKRNIGLAEEELRIIKEKNKLTPSSTADLDKESEAQVKVNQARAAGAAALRRIEKQLQSAGKTSKETADDAKKELDDILKRLEENGKTEIQKLEEKYKKELELLKKYHKDTTQLTKEYEAEKRRIELSYERQAIQGYWNLQDAYLSSLIQPSTEAFNEMISAATERRDTFIEKTRERLGEDFPPMLEEALVFDENGNLSDFTKHLSEMFSLGIEEGMDFEKINKRFNTFIKQIDKDVLESENALTAWSRELSNSAYELEKMKKVYQENLIADTYDNLTSLAIALGEANSAEDEYLRNKALKAKKIFDEVANLNEEELNALGYTLNDKINMEREYYEALEELRLHDYQNQQEMRAREDELYSQKMDAVWELKDAYVDSLDSIIDTYKTLIDTYKEDGKISEQEAKKKAKTLQWLEGIQGAVAVAGIVADTAAGWMSINKSLAAEYVLNAETAAATGPAAAATKAALDLKSNIAAGVRKAALIVNGIAAATAAVGKTIASIRGLSAESGDAGAASMAAAPQLIDSTPYSYTRELQTDVEREEMLNQPIYVRVTDIDEAQRRVRVTERETNF